MQVSDSRIRPYAQNNTAVGELHEWFLLHLELRARPLSSVTRTLQTRHALSFVQLWCRGIAVYYFGLFRFAAYRSNSHLPKSGGYRPHSRSV